MDVGWVPSFQAAFQGQVGSHRVGRVHIDGEDTCMDEVGRVAAAVPQHRMRGRIAGVASGIEVLPAFAWEVELVGGIKDNLDLPP